MTVGYGPVVPVSGLVLHLDGLNLRSYAGSGTSWNDLSSNRYSLTLQATPTYNAGNGSFTFNGTTQYAAQTSGVSTYNPANGITVLALVNPNSAAVLNSVVAHQSTISTNDGWRFVLRSTGVLGFTLGGVADYSSTLATTTAARWQHVGFTVTGTTVSYYTAGVFRDTSTIGAMSGTPASWQVGRDQGGVVEWMAGSINNLSAYNRVLSATEIQSHFNAYRGRYGI
jgi:hypothetical protein